MNTLRSLSLPVFTTIILVALMAAPSGYAEAGTAGYPVVGTAHFSKWAIPVYDATLKAPDGVYAEDKPFSLMLTYKLGLKGVKIAEQAAKEISLQKVDKAQLAKWQKELAGLIPDVKAGDTLTGMRNADGTMTLLKNGARVGEVKDKALTDAFFGIWLGSATSDPAQRSKLLGKV